MKEFIFIYTFILGIIYYTVITYANRDILYINMFYNKFTLF